ncbi:hypothetical protein BU52_29740 [Streptomyces toyocaensis]|uniref:Lipoprotein n=1 Tax=Streptomyces toyocaensis TaxID=55952 RepID=A0A081XJ91_STRTO|nr:hypothetical protein [Streptomyces toyocaensis]KES03614.1 hypothetical protein BU52_29740 [Streptomyces toyocaensis]
MFIRGSVTAVALLAVTLTACGTQQGAGQAARPESPRPSFSPRPLCAQPAEAPTVRPSPTAPSATGSTDGRREQGGDGAPHYAENHAYRMRGSLTPEEGAWGAASAELIRAELEKVREEGGAGEYGRFGEQRIAAALARLGCGEEHGTYIGDGYYSVHTAMVCVSGRVTEDELTTEVHGAYAEPQPGAGPCVENRGGH